MSCIVSLICCMCATCRMRILFIIFFHMKSHLIQLWNLYDINIEIFYCFIRHVYISKGANDECAELCDDTTSGSKGSFWIRLNRYIIRLCSTHQFKNLQVNDADKSNKQEHFTKFVFENFTHILWELQVNCFWLQVEMLYQRYFLRMNQSNTTHILSLLLALVLSLAAVHIILIPMESTSQFHKTLHRNRYNETINGNGSNISTIASLNRSGNITNVAPLINSQQQNFLRLNYNYSTGNETGKLAFHFLQILTMYSKNSRVNCRFCS